MAVCPCDSVVMAQDVCVIVGAEDRARLDAVVGDRRRPLKHVNRALFFLASANRSPVVEVAQASMPTRQSGCFLKKGSIRPRLNCRRKTTPPDPSTPWT